MNINAMGSMVQPGSYSTNMGRGNEDAKVMRNMMRQLPQADRQAIQEQMQALDQTQRKDALSQISQLDSTNMSSDDLTASILDILKPQKEQEDTTGLLSSFDTYA